MVFPDSLAGRAKINYDMYSGVYFTGPTILGCLLLLVYSLSPIHHFTGYVNVTAAPDYLFYWFFGTADGNKEAPLIIWTNGG